MLKKFYKNNLDKYILENITFRFITSALLIVIVFLIWIIISRTNTEKIVFMPPKVMAQEFWISGNEVSKSYLEEMAQFIAFNLMNVTKSNAISNIDNLMPLIEPEFYNKVKTVLVEQNEYIVDNAISRTFFLSQVNADTKGIIEVYGVVKDIIGDKVITSKQYIINIGYKIKQGRFFINSIEAKENK